MSDGVPPGMGRSVAEAIEHVVEILVFMGRNRGCDEDRIRRDIRRAFGHALEVDSYHKAINFEGKGRPDMIILAGMFRLVFDEWALDREDQFMQESWFVIANRAMEDALAKTRDRDH